MIYNTDNDLHVRQWPARICSSRVGWIKCYKYNTSLTHSVYKVSILFHSSQPSWKRVQSPMPTRIISVNSTYHGKKVGFELYPGDSLGIWDSCTRLWGKCVKISETKLARYVSISHRILQLTNVLQLYQVCVMQSHACHRWSNVFRPGALAEALTGQALKAGYRHVSRAFVFSESLLTRITISQIDSAAVYANEKECVSAVRAAGLKRSDVFLTTKISPQAFGYDAARQSIDESLEQAQTEYFDLCVPFLGRDDISTMLSQTGSLSMPLLGVRMAD